MGKTFELITHKSQDLLKYEATWLIPQSQILGHWFQVVVGLFLTISVSWVQISERTEVFPSVPFGGKASSEHGAMPLS